MAVSIPIYVLSDRMYITMLLIGAACMLTCANVIFRKVPRLSDLLFSCLPLFSVLVPGLCMLTFQQHPEPLMRVYFILISFGIPLMGDTLALFGGRRFGKRALCPEVSPKKTIEGAVCGQLSSILSGLIAWWLLGLSGSPVPLRLCLVTAFLAAFMGQIGDLAESLLKRMIGVKDFSNLIPGHGGVFDRADSLLFSIPTVYLCFLVVGI
jgi:phosphatidate cytidylyltransferase